MSHDTISDVQLMRATGAMPHIRVTGVCANWPGPHSALYHEFSVYDAMQSLSNHNVNTHHNNHNHYNTPPTH